MKNLLKSVFLLSLSVVTLRTSAQQNISEIQGKVLNKQQPVESAMVSLLLAKDSSVVKTTLADKTGLFRFQEVGVGKYLILTNMLGFERAYTGPFEWNGSGTKMLPAIQLLSKSNGLAEVTVSSKKPLIEQKADRTIVNVEASPTNAGATALEILEKSPGI